MTRPNRHSRRVDAHIESLESYARDTCQEPELLGCLAALRESLAKERALSERQLKRATREIQNERA